MQVIHKKVGNPGDTGQITCWGHGGPADFIFNAPNKDGEVEFVPTHIVKVINMSNTAHEIDGTNVFFEPGTWDLFAGPIPACCLKADPITGNDIPTGNVIFQFSGYWKKVE